MWNGWNGSIRREGSRAAKAWRGRGEALLACAGRRPVEMEVEFHLLM